MKKKILMGVLIVAVILIGAIVLIICLPNSNNNSNQGTTTQPTQPTEKHDHIWSEWVTEKDSTCAEKGIKSRTCECGAKDQILFAELEHSQKPRAEESRILKRKSQLLHLHTLRVIG